MTLESLLRIIPPPAKPTETGKSGEDWSNVEQTLGATLPQDYKTYINTYGSGEIGGFLSPYNPFSTNRFLNLASKITMLHDALRIGDQIARSLNALRVTKEQIDDDDEEWPYPLYPEPGGLLPWGSTDNGDYLFWLTIGDPDQWPVVTYQPRGRLGSTFERFEETMTSFIAKAFSGKIKGGVLPSASYLRRNTRFDVYDPNKQQE